jgi:hypothetical protein
MAVQKLPYGAAPRERDEGREHGHHRARADRGRDAGCDERTAERDPQGPRFGRGAAGRGRVRPGQHRARDVVWCARVAAALVRCAAHGREALSGQLLGGRGQPALDDPRVFRAEGRWSRSRRRIAAGAAASSASTSWTWSTTRRRCETASRRRSSAPSAQRSAEFDDDVETYFAFAGPFIGAEIPAAVRAVLEGADQTVLVPSGGGEQVQKGHRRARDARPYPRKARPLAAMEPRHRRPRRRCHLRLRVGDGHDARGRERDVGCDATAAERGVRGAHRVVPARGDRGHDDQRRAAGEDRLGRGRRVLRAVQHAAHGAHRRARDPRGAARERGPEGCPASDAKGRFRTRICGRCCAFSRRRSRAPRPRRAWPQQQRPPAPARVSVVEPTPSPAVAARKESAKPPSLAVGLIVVGVIAIGAAGVLIARKSPNEATAERATQQAAQQPATSVADAAASPEREQQRRG